MLRGAAGADVTVSVVGDADAAFVAAAKAAADVRLAAFGLALAEDSRVIVYGDVHDFVLATGQTTPSLRAWSTYRTIHLLPPSTWTDPSSTSSRLSHELCHLALWQRAGEAKARAIPRFVGEGVCSVVADQGALRMPAAEVKARADDGSSVDFDDDAAFAYGYAHAVFAAAAACGIDIVDVADATAAGARVEDALGGAPRAFLDGCPEVGRK